MDEAEAGLKALYLALAIHEIEFNLSDANYVLNAIGIVLKKVGNYDEAIQVYERVLKNG
jgi:tetratricopeptide (TPR) repeat protein